MKEEFSTQIESCLQSYSGINDTINQLNNEHPEVDKTVFSDFFQILETFFSVFSNTKDILTNFSTLNLSACSSIFDIKSKPPIKPNPG